jgi:RNA polymerase sigma factor (sigma-70 family)
MQTDVNDDLLLQNLKSRDTKSYETMFNRFEKFLLFEAYRLLGNMDEAKDVVQDFFIDFFEKERYNTIRSNLKGYLYMSIRYNCMLILKRQKSKDKSLKEYCSIQEEPMVYLENEEVTAFEALDTRVSEIMKFMPAQAGRAFQLYVIDGMKRKEVANIMGLSDNTVKTHLATAIKTLRKKLLSPQ